MIYKTINKYDMIEIFRKWNKLKTSQKDGNFTVEAVKELFDYYDDYRNYELDVIGICCEWTQYDDIEEVREAYLDNVAKPSEYDSYDVLEYLEDNTYHIVLSDDSILVREF